MKVNLEKPFIDGTQPFQRPQRTPKADGGSDFVTSFAQAVSDVSNVAKEADQAADGLVAGTVDMHEALVSMEKADLMLKLGTTVRNKLLDAYQQLMSSGAG